MSGWTPLSPNVVIDVACKACCWYIATTSLLRRFFYSRFGCAKERVSSGCSFSTDEGVLSATYLRPKTWREAECSGRRNAKAALLQVPGTFGDADVRRIVYPTPRRSSAPRATDCKSVYVAMVFNCNFGIYYFKPYGKKEMYETVYNRIKLYINV